MLNAYGLDDGSGMSVSPQFGAGSVSPNMAAPSLAEGGAIPDDDDMTGDASPNTDVVDYSGAMQIVRQALNYGREQHGLPASRPQESEDTGIPDEEDSTESYEDGGIIEDDIAMSNAAGPDEEQYGRPEVVDDPDAVRPPISSDNTDYQAIPTEAPYPQGGDPMEGDDARAAPAPMSQFKGEMVNDDDLPPGEGGQPRKQLRDNPQMTLGYLMGKGAAPPETLDEYRKQVDPTGGKTVAERNLLAVTKAPEEARWPLLQTQRGVYNSSIAHALAAYNGVEGRPPSLEQAAASASKAYDNLLDGVTTTFKAEGDGVIAHVKPPGSDTAQTFKLTPQQFGSMLDPGKGGMYDALLERGGATNALKQAAQAAVEGPAAPAQPRANAPGATPRGQVNSGEQARAPTHSQFASQARALPGETTNDRAGRPGAQAAAADSDRAVTMSHDMALLKASPQYKAQNPNWGKSPERVYSPEERRAMSPSKADRIQANKLEQIEARNAGKGAPRDYLAEIKARNEGAMERAKLTDTGKTQRATAGIDSRTQLAADKLMEQAKEREARNGRNAASNAERLLVGKMLNGQKLTPEDNALIQGMNQRAAQTVRQPAAAAAPSGGGERQLSPQDQAAVSWANSHPEDPRAARIKQLHGIQ